MKSMTVDDSLYAALEAAAGRDGRPVQEVLNDAIESWLADASMDDADHDEVALARAEYVERGGVEFEEFFSDLLEDRS